MATNKAIKPMTPRMPKHVLGGPIKDNKQDKMNKAPLHGVHTKNQDNMFPYRSGGK